MIKGVIVFNIDIGQLPVSSIESQIAWVKSTNAELITQLVNQQYGLAFLTNRNGNNSLEFMPLS